MKIEFSEQQLTLLKEIINEYSDSCYHSMIEYQRVAVDADDEYIAKEYASLAQAEEEHFCRCKDLIEYIVKYEDLMGGR